MEIDAAKPAKLYKLMNAEGDIVTSSTPGTIGGNSDSKIWGSLDCSAARSAGPSYAKVRVFFANSEDATAAGYRPCGTCQRNEYAKWKSSLAA